MSKNNKWVRPEDSAPEIGKPVLVVVNGVVRTGVLTYFSFNDRELCLWNDPHSEGNEWGSDDVTYWMELPKIPEQKITAKGETQRLTTRSRLALRRILFDKKLLSPDVLPHNYSENIIYEPPKDLVSMLSYKEIKKIENVGSESLRNIIDWLNIDGFELRDMPKRR